MHRREPTPIDKQTVIRMNRDTHYSAAVFDLDAGAVTIALPDADGRFMSMQVIDEDEYTREVDYKPGGHTFTKLGIGTRYVLAVVRTLVVSVRRRPPCCEGARREGCDLRASLKVTRRWMGRFSGSSADGVGAGTRRRGSSKRLCFRGPSCARSHGGTAWRRAWSSHGEGRLARRSQAGETARFCCLLRSERRRRRQGPGRQDIRADGEWTTTEVRGDRNRA